MSVDIVWGEDSGADQLLIQTVLDEVDPPLKVAFAEDGAHAVRLATRSRPRLVVLDLQMPRMGGLDALGALRRDPALAGTKVIVFSSAGRPEDVEAANALGAAGFVQKPLDFPSFRAAVRSIAAHAAVTVARQKAASAQAVAAASPGNHHVLFWDAETVLLDAVTRFLHGGARKGNGLVALATPDHIARLQPLAPREVAWLDTTQVLHGIARDGRPDPELFQRLLADTLDKASRKGTRRVTFFGELVAVLHRQGHGEAALAIEAVGQTVAAREGTALSILCAYPVQAMGEDAFATTCALHTGVTRPTSPAPSLAPRP